MNIDPLLREAMHTNAGTVRMQRRADGLAPAARRRARQRRTRHLIAAAATVVAVVAAGAVIVPLLARPGGDLVLVPASYVLPDFPYTPGWVPDGVADSHVQLWGAVADRFDQEVVVEHEAAEGESGRVLIQMRIISRDEAGGDSSGGLSEEEVVVRGAPGVLTTDGRWLSVTWTDPADRLVQVGASDREVGRDGLLRYVEELVARPLPVTPPVTLVTVPAGADVTTVAPYRMQMDLPGGRWLALTVHDPTWVDDLRADLRISPDYRLPPPVPVEVAGRPAELVDIGGGRLALSIRFGPEQMLTIEPWPGDREGLLAFAAGVTLTRYARPAPFA